MSDGSTVVHEAAIVHADLPSTWAYVTDPNRFAEWIVGYEPHTDEMDELREGVSFRWRLRMGPLSVPASETVTSWHPRTSVGFSGDLGGVRFTSTLQLEQVGSGRTRLTVIVAPELPRWLPERPTRSLLARSVRRSLEAVARRAADDPQANERVTHLYRFWGRHPGWYAASDRLTFLGRQEMIRRQAVAALRLRPGDRVLEIGCGTGRNLGYLVEAVGTTGEIVGVDYSQEMLAAAERLVRRRGWRNIRLIRADAADLPVEGPFNGVLAVLALSAIPHHRRALQRCHEVLALDGRLSVCDARPFTGWLAILNPLVRTLYGRLAAWDPDRDLVRDVRHLFGNVQQRRYNLGTFFVVAANRSNAHDRHHLTPGAV